MSRCSWLVSVLAAVAISAGCDERQQNQAKRGGGPTTAPSTTQLAQIAAAPTTEPATRPANSQLTIDGHVYSFPPARLRVSQANRNVIARLYSDDPKAAISDEYKGNGYDLVMHLDDIHDPTQVYAAVWQYKARSREYSDALQNYGIFLEGTKYQLQPYDVTARFLGDPGTVRVEVDGEFLQFDTTDAASQPKSVSVKGFLLARVEYKD